MMMFYPCLVLVKPAGEVRNLEEFLGNRIYKTLFYLSGDTETIPNAVPGVFRSAIYWLQIFLYVIPVILWCLLVPYKAAWIEMSCFYRSESWIYFG